MGSPGMHVASSQTPPFPGRQYTCETRGDWRSFHTSACSLPPPPITKTFIDKKEYYQKSLKSQTSEDIAFDADSSAHRRRMMKPYSKLRPWLTLCALTAEWKCSKLKKLRLLAATCANISVRNAAVRKSSIAARHCGRSCQRQMKNQARTREFAISNTPRVSVSLDSYSRLFRSIRGETSFCNRAKICVHLR